MSKPLAATHMIVNAESKKFQGYACPTCADKLHNADESQICVKVETDNDCEFCRQYFIQDMPESRLNK